MSLAHSRTRPGTTTALATLLTTALFTLPAWAVQDGADEPELVLGDVAFRRIQQQANTFQSSTQDEVAMDRDAHGNTVVVWQSRRQEGGGYGIYAQRFDAAGRRVGDEVHVNATTRGMQMAPAVALEPSGAAWFAWRSFGQDGDQGAIVARKFDPTLQSATREVVVNEWKVGNQDDVSLAALPGGAVLVVWTSPSEGSARREIHARRLGRDGIPAGDVIRVDQGEGADANLPAAGADAEGNATIAWARTDANGAPIGIFARRMNATGAFLGAEFRADDSTGAHTIEPALAVAGNGRIVIAWMQAEEGGYGVRTRAYALDGDELVAGPVRVVETGGPASGLALDLGANGDCLVAWSRYEDALKGDKDLFARVYGADGAPQTDAFLVTAGTRGSQTLAVGRGTRRALLMPDGCMAFAWHGDSGLGDESSAGWTLLVPEGLELAEGLAVAAVAREPGFAPPEAGAAPHDPPTFDPRDIDREIGGMLDPASPGSEFDFLAITNTGWTPPDPHMAVGPDHVVVMTNGAIAFFTDTGTFQFQNAIEGGSGFWGSLGATGLVFDPEVVYDTHSGRFMAMAAERDFSNSLPFFLLAVSDDSDPNGVWHKYRINVLAAASDTDIDSPNIATDENFVYLTADFFGPDKYLVYIIDKPTVLSGGLLSAANTESTLITPQQSLGIPVSYDASPPAQYMIWSQEGSGHTTVTVFAITSQLSSPVIQSTNVVVPTYNHPENPPQGGTSQTTLTFEERFWSCVYRNGSLWATHHVGNPVKQRWYQIDMAGWPSGGTPSLVQWGEVSPGPQIRTYFGSLWVDENDNMALVYARSSGTERISMERTHRVASDPLGTTRTPVRVIDSTSPNNTNRWGDYSAVVDDPVDANTFWAHGEYRTGSWRTRVAKFTVCDGGTSNYCSTAPNSVGSGATMFTAGTTSVSANDLVLRAELVPNQPGTFFYGPQQASVPFGNGTRCVAGQIGRLGVVNAVGNVMTFPLDNTNPSSAATQITPGSTWYFQAWFRDPAAGGALFNLSDGIEARFCP